MNFNKKDIVTLIILLIVCIASFITGYVLRETMWGVALIVIGLVLFAFVFKIGFNYTDSGGDEMQNDDKTQK